MARVLSPWNFAASLVPGYRVNIGRASSDRWIVWAEDGKDEFILGAHGRAGPRLFATLDSAYSATRQAALDGRIRAVVVRPGSAPEAS